MSDDRIQEATPLGVIGIEPNRVNEQIGFRENGKIDSNDYFKFTIAEESDLKLSTVMAKAFYSKGLTPEQSQKTLILS